MSQARVISFFSSSCFLSDLAEPSGLLIDLAASLILLLWLIRSDFSSLLSFAHSSRGSIGYGLRGSLFVLNFCSLVVSLVDFLSEVLSLFVSGLSVKNVDTGAMVSLLATSTLSFAVFTAVVISGLSATMPFSMSRCNDAYLSFSLKVHSVASSDSEKIVFTMSIW